jgi:hypothetical protein
MRVNTSTADATQALHQHHRHHGRGLGVLKKLGTGHFRADVEAKLASRFAPDASTQPDPAEQTPTPVDPAPEITPAPQPDPTPIGEIKPTPDVTPDPTAIEPTFSTAIDPPATITKSDASQLTSTSRVDLIA